MSGDAVVQPRRVIEIKPSHGWQLIDLREVLEYRELLAIFVWRDLKVRYRQTLLGVAWVVAQPLLTMLFFTLLFNRVAKIAPDANVPYSLFVLAALVPWTFFATSVAASGNSLIGSSHLISKVYFPRIIIPAASVAGALVDMLVTMALVGLLMIVFGVALSVQAVILPLVILIAAVLAFGTGLWLSALNIEYRDMRVITPFLLQLWLYATPVLYPLGALPAWAQRIAALNPMTPIVEAFRRALFGGAIPWLPLLYAAAISAVVLMTGALYFRRSERQFADIL